MRFVNVAIVANIQLGIVHWNWILATTATFQSQGRMVIVALWNCDIVDMAMA